MIVVVLVLVVALVFAGPQILQSLAVILGLSGFLLMCRVPVRIVLSLCGGAILITGTVSLVSEALSMGALPLVGAGILVAGTIGLWTRTFRAPPRSRGAHWATLRELRRGGFLVEHGWTLGAVDSHTVRLPMERERESILITGATGSGKTSIFVIRALIEEASREAAERRHVVVVDPKGELTTKTLPTLALTHRVLMWDPSIPGDCTVGCDPLSTLPDQSDERWVGEVKQLAHAYFWATRGGDQVTDQFFIMMPRAVMESAFLAFLAMYPRGTFVELADWIRSLKLEAFQSLLDQSANPAVRASAETLRALGMSDRSIGPIWGEVLTRFDVFDDPRVRRSMSGPTWSFGPEPIALYLRVAAVDAQRLAPLLSLALGQLYRELTTAASKTSNHRLPREFRVVMDEFGNLPRIHGLDVALAMLRSAGVGHCLAVQSTSQVTYHYGQKLAETIQDNLVTRIILGPASEADAKAFSQRCGDLISYHPNPGWSRQGLFGRGSRSYSYSPERRPLIPPDEIIHMRDTVLVSTRGISPIRATAMPYFADQELMRRIQAAQASFAQQGAAVTDTQPTPPAAEPGVQRGSRDVPPPGCSPQEWDAAAASLQVALWSMEDDLFALVTGRTTDLDQVRAQWQANPNRSTPERYSKVTAADRAKAPSVAAYVDELALRLELRQEA